MNPEINAIVLFGKAGRKMELPIGFDVNGVIIDQHNEEEFHCEEVKPMIFRISHNGQSILVGSHRHPKKLHSHKNGGCITQDPHPAVMREGDGTAATAEIKIVDREGHTVEELNEITEGNYKTFIQVADAIKNNKGSMYTALDKRG